MTKGTIQETPYLYSILLQHHFIYYSPFPYRYQYKTNNMKNICSVPTLKAKKIIERIEKNIQLLDKAEKDAICNIISIHECEPMAAAERIADELQISYESVFELL
jgi:hypothetical protein